MNDTSTILRIREVDSPAGLTGLKEAWEALLPRSEANSVFLSWEHLRTWWEVYGDVEMKLRVLLAEDDQGRLLGIAPLLIAPGDTPFKSGFRHLVFLGGMGDSLSEYLDFIIERGKEKAVVDLFADYVCEEMRSDWDVVRFGMTKSDSATMKAFVERLSEAGTSIFPVMEHPSPSLELSGSWDEFLAGRSQNFRRGVRVARRKLETGRVVSKRLITDESEIEEAMKTLGELNRKRWGEEGDAFQSAEFETFHQKLAKRFLRRGWLYLSVIEADGVAIGARYDFVYGGKMWCFQGGWDPAFAGVGLGKVMVADVVEWAIGQGLSEYDFLGGEARYKKEWSSMERTLVDFEGINPWSLRGRAFNMLKTVKKAVFGAGEKRGKAHAA